MLRLVLASLLIGLAAAPAASAASTIEVLRDCADDGRLQGHYTPAELRKARKHIPTDTDEYTDCRDVLARAAADAVANRGAGGAGGSASGGGGGVGGVGDIVAPETQSDRDAIAAAARQGAPDPVKIDGRSVVPGASGLAANAVRNGIPATLVVVLVLLGAAALAAAALVARRRILAAAPVVFRRVFARFKR